MTLLQKLENLVELSQPMQVTTPGGVKYLRKATFLPEAFWEFYRENKESLRELGVRVSKFRGNWQCEHWANSSTGSFKTLKKDESAPDIEVKPLKYPDMVLEYQMTSVQMGVASMEKNNFCILGHSTGVGKTFISLFIARELGKKVFVVCPKPIVTDWSRACDRVGVEFIGIHGWEWTKLGKTEFGSLTEEVGPRGRKTKKFTWNLPDDVILIIDEVHRGKTDGTINSLLVKAAIDQKVPFLALSATIAETPMNLAQIGRACNLHQGGQTYYNFLMRHGVKKGKFGLFFTGNQYALKEIHRRIFPAYGNRLKAEELGDAFPETTIHAKAYDMDSAKQIASAYEELENRVQEIYETIPAADRQGAILAERIKTRRAIELHKAPAFVDMALDLIDSGNSVFIAVNFRETLQFIVDSIQKSIGKCGFIVGQQNENERRGFIDAFQRDDIRCMVAIVQAAREGISLHDVNGRYPRHSLISPCESATDLKQVLGRVHRSGGKSKSFQSIVYAAGVEIEESICYSLDEKLKRISLLMDGDLDPSVAVAPQQPN